MTCERVLEQLSDYLDGELSPPEAARLSAHIEGCAPCRQAQEAFLLFRQELRAYDWAPDPLVQSRALSAILNSRTAEAEAVTPSVWERLADRFTLRHLRPAHVATLAFLLIVTALGVRWLIGTLAG